MARSHISLPEAAKYLTVSVRLDTTVAPETVKKSAKVDVIAVPPSSYQPNSKIEDPEAVLGPSIGRPVEGAASVSDLGSEVSSLSAAKPEYPWSGYKDDVIPSKTQSKIIRNLRHQIFTLYRRLFGVVFVTNIAVFISVLFKGANAQQIATIVIANLFCAILMRQDYVINAFFNTFCAVPPSYVVQIVFYGNCQIWILTCGADGPWQFAASVLACTTSVVYTQDVRHLEWSGLYYLPDRPPKRWYKITRSGLRISFCLIMC